MSETLVVIYVKV